MPLFNPFLKGAVGTLFAGFAVVGLLKTLFGTVRVGIPTALLLVLLLGGMGYWLLHDAHVDYKRMGKIWYW